MRMRWRLLFLTAVMIGGFFVLSAAVVSRLPINSGWAVWLRAIEEHPVFRLLVYSDLGVLLPDTEVKEDKNQKQKQIQEQKNSPQKLVNCSREVGEFSHLVKKGESLFSIARKYLVFEYQLREWNNLAGDLIRPGQELLVKKLEWPAYEGKASWYGKKFHGQKMANGKKYNMHNVLVAHRRLPLGLPVRITNLENGRTIRTKVLDRGPYFEIDGAFDREIDLSYAAAKELGALAEGVIPVRIEPIS